MADRNLNFDPTVTGVTPKMPDLGLATGGAELADQVATMSANSKALNATTQTALAFRQADAQFRQDAASNPNDPEALAKLQASRAQITSQIGQQVPAIASREYMAHVMEVQQNSDKLNELWGMQQSVKNAHADVQSSMATQAQMFADKGRQFGADGGNFANLDTVLSLEQSQAAIAKFAVPVLGEEQTKELMKNSATDNVKAFITGLAESHPVMAAAALQQPNIAEHFTPKDIGDMADLIKKTERQQQLIQNLQTTKNDGGLVDIVNDPNSDYLHKRLTIEQQMAAGNISPKAGKSALAILHTQDDIDTVTDTPTMHDIINRTYDLNSKASAKADDYLNGVKDLHQQILEAQANGQLTAADASKVTKQVNDLTEKKLADATNTAGSEFRLANKQFDTLPPEYRGQATRALFYAGYGQKWTPQQYSSQATQIIQQINNQRRQDARKTLDSVAQDDAFVKSLGFTNNDIQSTAKQYGISPQEVILQLRAHAGSAARAKQTNIKRITGGADDDERVDEPAKPVELHGAAEPDNDREINEEMAQ